MRKIAEILQLAASPSAVEELLAAVTLNVLLGNGDAHGKNFSLLHDPGGTLALAPLYDLLCTLAYGDDRLAMYIDDVRRTDRVTADRIVKEAAGWGLSTRRAEAIVADVLDRTPKAVVAARDEIPDVPAEMPEMVLSQHSRLLAG